MPEPSNPVEVFDLIRARAVTIAQTAFMESGKPWPSPDVVDGMIMPLLGIGIAAASEHYAMNPQHLAISGMAICEVCREPVQTLQVGVDPAIDEQDSAIARVAWPCGHRQPSGG